MRACNGTLQMTDLRCVCTSDSVYGGTGRLVGEWKTRRRKAGAYMLKAGHLLQIWDAR